MALIKNTAVRDTVERAQLINSLEKVELKILELSGIAALLRDRIGRAQGDDVMFLPISRWGVQ